MNRPFVYGYLAEKENFIDRIEERRQLKTFLGNGINVMLISPRRCGKSSLVKATMTEMLDENKDVLIDTNAPQYESDISSLTMSQIAMLKAIANGEQKLSSAAVVSRYNLGGPQTILRNKKILISRDIIEQGTETRYRFVDPVFLLWFRQNNI